MLDEGQKEDGAYEYLSWQRNKLLESLLYELFILEITSENSTSILYWLSPPAQHPFVFHLKIFFYHQFGSIKY